MKAVFPCIDPTKALKGLKPFWKEVRLFVWMSLSPEVFGFSLHRSCGGRQAIDSPRAQQDVAYSLKLPYFSRHVGDPISCWGRSLSQSESSKVVNKRSSRVVSMRFCCGMLPNPVFNDLDPHSLEPRRRFLLSTPQSDSSSSTNQDFLDS